jgi:hypothetical protein
MFAGEGDLQGFTDGSAQLGCGRKCATFKSRVALSLAKRLLLPAKKY